MCCLFVFFFKQKTAYEMRISDLSSDVCSSDLLSLISFPIRQLFELRLNEFDLIIFDRYRRRGVLPNLYLANIANYVQEGGAFLEASATGRASCWERVCQNV